ncbi:hypothetical protein [Cryobacterium sp. GrIS_2_6]|uniref:hypothetical protein n=1 Tax=Cryobacterium sp. GrIS_2_6 TaxID=3162785 RepID=UPI002E0A184D|nr:hypothetical protein [Cryobacterium psychrotolerans]
MRSFRCGAPARAEPRNGVGKKAQIDAASVRKKNRMTTTRAAPVSTSAAADTPASAPLPNSALVTKPITAFLAASNWVASSDSGPVVG